MYLHRNFSKIVAMATANFPGRPVGLCDVAGEGLLSNYAPRNAPRRHLTPHPYESFAIAPGTPTL